MSWVSPTGHNDPNNKWSNETNAYDEATNTYAQEYLASSGWGYFLELLHDAIYCSKIQHFSWRQFIGQQIDIDAYWDGAWHDIYEGIFADYEWEEREFGGTYYVTAVRVRYTHQGYDYARICELDFYEEEAPTTPPPNQIMIIG